MRKRYVVAMLAVFFVVCGLSVQNVSGISPNILISQIKVGNSTTSRLVEIYNNSDMPVDVTNWCLEYSSPSNTVPYTDLGCFNNPDPATHILLRGRSFALLASTQTGILSDIVLVPGLGFGISGHVYLMDDASHEVDRVGWGLAVNAEANQPIALGTTKVIERRQSVVPGVLVDTDNNESDFMDSTLRAEYQYGALDEVVDVCQNQAGIQEIVPIDYTVDQTGNCLPPPVDVCPNIDSLQLVVPPGYELDESGACMLDVCTNLAGLQLILPSGKEFDQSGACVDHDECANLAGIQAVLPGGYKLTADGMCLLDLLPIKITELLANPYGSDTGKEFIELYNPNETAVDLGLYVLKIGAGAPKLYPLPAGSHIASKGYATFSNSDIPYTLVNTSGQVTVMTADGVVVDESLAYSDSKDDMAWALIDGTWQYTNQSTPGTGNIPSFVESDEKTATTSDLAPCASNQYRSLETNRCRLLTAASSVLTPCKDGQYRSEETNRCRSIAVDAGALVSCGDNQERNLATNRCRLVAVAEVPAACKQGQERNPETNRCRTSVAISAAAYPVEAIDVGSGGYIGWLAVGSVGILAVSYGVWEWRTEIIQATQKLRSFFHHKK